VGLIGVEEVLGSAVVAAVISLGTSIAVALVTRRTTLRAVRVTAAEARGEQARAALERAIQGWQIAAKEEAEMSARQGGAAQGRAALIALALIPGFEIEIPEFEQILALLGSASEDDLRQAAKLWPSVEGQLREVVAPRDLASGFWRKVLPGG
jgi:heme exporter protein D